MQTMAATCKDYMRFLGLLILLVLIALCSLIGFIDADGYYLVPLRKEPTIAHQITTSRDIYSAHNCVGNGKRGGKDQDAMRCHFRNVCLELNEHLGDFVDTKQVHFGVAKPSSVKMTYFRPTQAKGTPLFWYASYVLNWSWVRIDSQSRLSPGIEYRSVPKDALWSTAESTVLSGSYWPENYAHALGDDFLPVYRLARSFGLWSRDLQVIFHPDCSRRGSASRKGCVHHEEMSKMLLERPLETKSSPLWSNNQTVCFQNLLVGTRGLGMSTASERIWPPFVAEMKSHFGLQLRPQPKAQKITVFRKNGRRTLTNYEEVADHLRKRFDVEVEVWEPAKFSIPDQIKYLETTTVVVTPCGGVSFSSLFLPPGSSAIFVDFWETKSNQSAHMDQEVLTYQNDVTPFYYNIEQTDLTLNRSLIPKFYEGDEQVIIRSYANVTIVNSRMEKYVFAALLQAEVNFGLSNTFRMDSESE